MTFGEKIRAARLALNLSQEELAERTGLTPRTLYSYEKGKALPRESNLEKLAEALHVPLRCLSEEGDEGPAAAADPAKTGSPGGADDAGQYISRGDTGPEELPGLDAFLAEVQHSYGSRGQREAQDVLERAGALFAGGDLDETAKDVLIQSLMRSYLTAKEKASQKFSPNSRKKRRTER